MKKSTVKFIARAPLYLMFGLISILVSCQKEGETPASEIQDSSSNEDVLKIAPSQEVFSAWVERVLVQKGYKEHEEYAVAKIKTWEELNFQLAEISLKLKHGEENFFTATPLKFVGAPQHSRYLAKPVKLYVPNPFIKSLIFSSGKNSNTFLEVSGDSAYCFTTADKNLNFITVGQ